MSQRLPKLTQYHLSGNTDALTAQLAEIAKRVTKTERQRAERWRRLLLLTRK